jgi:hypothetical protein
VDSSLSMDCDDDGASFFLIMESMAMHVSLC